MKNIKKLIACLLCLALILSLAACGSSNTDSSSPTDVETSPETEPTPDTQPEQSDETENADDVIAEGSYVTYLSLYLAENADSYKSLNAYDDGMGGVYVDFQSEIRKAGSLELSAFEELTAALRTSGLAALNGQSEYTDGEGYASMYIELSDGTYLTADYSGTIPEAFANGFAAMEQSFTDLTAEMPEYVPQAQVMGDVSEELLAAMQEIVNNSGMTGLDSLAISDIPMDEYFSFTAGLSSADGIAAGAACTAMMMTTPYSLVIVKLDDAADTEPVRADFEASLDWQKWVCVLPTNALIAEKDGMVLCLMGSDSMYLFTADAIEAAGWNNIVTYDNPAM